jgi:hypothetical protein
MQSLSGHKQTKIYFEKEKKMNKNIQDMTREEFEALPARKWNEDIGEIDSIIIIPAKINAMDELKFILKKYLSRMFSWVKEPELPDGIHDSGYRCMDFIACKHDQAIIRLSGCSDVINIEGIGGFGFDWFRKYNSCPPTISVSGWSIDCLLRSGLLRLFNGKKIIVGQGSSNFEIYSK